MSKRSDEEALKEMFLSYLEETEHTKYEVIGVDVPNRSRTKNFDYLLRAEDAKTVALEITVLSDNEDDFKDNARRESIRHRVRETILERLDELPAGIIVEIPYKFSATRKNLDSESQRIASKIIDAVIALGPNQRSDLPSEIGNFKVWRAAEGERFLLIGSFSGDSWSTHWHDVANMFSMLLKRLREKNEQLDSEADRKVMLIGRMAGQIDREAISEALAELRGTFGNIEELYVCYGNGDIERYW